jgi:hypothetical protein
MNDYILKNKYKKIWLDLELREDIDDYATLIFALENKLNITEISIHNPSVFELSLLQQTLLKFADTKIDIIISGEVTTYTPDKDIHSSLMEICSGKLGFIASELNDCIKNIDMTDKIVFCGGSLYTLSEILKVHSTITIDAYIQGGYAGEKIVGAENVLKKFKNREQVPTWNLNLDLDATDYVMAADNVNCHFVSKNVCHASFVGIKDLSLKDSFFNEVLSNYFSLNNHRKNIKCMHDLVAFLSIFNDDLIIFKNVELKRTNDDRVKWYSILKPNSNKKISCSLDYQLFIKIIRN